MPPSAAPLRTLPIGTNLHRRRATSLLLGWPWLGHAAAADAGTLRATGTGSALGGIRLVAEAFLQRHPDLRIELLPAIGSPGAIKALAARRIDVALSNRAPIESETAAMPMRTVEYARTPLVVAVAPSVGVRALTSDELAALYTPGATFANGQRARPVLRLPNAADLIVLRSISPAVARAIDAAATQRGMLVAATDRDAADLLQSSPGAFGGCTLAMIESERRPLVALALDGRVPSVDNLENGRYPFFKRLYAIVPTQPPGPASDFAAFLQSAEARAVLRAHGHLPV